MRSLRVVGVLGGMGPGASCRFLERLMACARTDHGARANEDFPHVLLSNLPVSDLVRDTRMEEATVAAVEAEARVLARAGADFLVMPCHTMHAFLERLEARAERPFLSMIDLTRRELQRDGRRRVGLLATPTTLDRGLYQAPLTSIGAEAILPRPDEIGPLADIVLRGVAGTLCASDSTALAGLCASLVERGADSVVLGCTELSLVEPFRPAERMGSVKIYDPLWLLARATCDRVYRHGQDRDRA